MRRGGRNKENDNNSAAMPGKRACVRCANVCWESECVLKAARLFAETGFYGLDLLGNNIAVWKMFQFVAVQNTQTHVHLHPHSHSISEVKNVLCKSEKWGKYLHQLFLFVSIRFSHLFACSLVLSAWTSLFHQQEKCCCGDGGSAIAATATAWQWEWNTSIATITLSTLN